MTPVTDETSTRPTPSAGSKPSYTELGTREKLEDFRYLYETFRDNHSVIPVMKRLTGYDWLEHGDEFEEQLKKTEIGANFAAVMRKILRVIGDPHTQIVPWDVVRSYGTTASYETCRRVVRERGLREAANYWFRQAHAYKEPRYMSLPVLYHAGEYVVVGNFHLEGAAIGPGYRVVEVDGVPVDQYVSERSFEIAVYCDPIRRKTYQPQLRVPRRPGGVRVSLRHPEGKLTEINLPEDYFSTSGELVLPRRHPRYAKKEGTVLATDLFAKVFPGKAAYIHLRRMFRWSGKGLARFKEFLKSVRDLPALIIDVRGNSGGECGCWLEIIRCVTAKPVEDTVRYLFPPGDYARGLLEELKSFGARVDAVLPDSSVRVIRTETVLPEDSINYQGRIYVLADEHTYSAAAQFARFSKESGWATLVGTRPRGGWIFQCVPLILPNSRMAITFPIGVELNADLTVREEFPVLPDVPVDDYDSFLRSSAALIHSPETLEPEHDVVLARCLELVER